MLSESSYLSAIYVYTGAAGLMLLCLLWWFRRSPAWAALLVLLAAALLLTPAYPKGNVDTLAPALIVAAFQLLTDGVEAAEHALRPLAVMSAAALVLALLLRFTLFRKRREATPSPVPLAENDADTGAAVVEPAR